MTRRSTTPRCVNCPDAEARPHPIAEHGYCQHGYLAGRCVEPVCPGFTGRTPSPEERSADLVSRWFNDKPGRVPSPDVDNARRIPLSPDCGQRKCTACSGDAWDLTVDRPAHCACVCHDVTCSEDAP